MSRSTSAAFFSTASSLRGGSWWLLACVACVLTSAQPARAAGTVPLQQARLALAHYDLEAHDSTTLAALTQLSALMSDDTLDASEHNEVRFLRAAAASDLLVMAHVRSDLALQKALAAALGVGDGSVYDLLDAELASFSQPNYRRLTGQIRSALGSMRKQEAWPLPTLADTTGPQRDLLFVHSFIAACATDDDMISALSRNGRDPCADAAHCAEPYAAFDLRGRVAVHALMLAGQALVRVQAAVKAGDPLLTAAESDLAVFQILLADIELRPSPRPAHDETWMDASGSPSKLVPDLMLWVSEQGMRYGFVPRVRLSAEGALQLEAAGEPALPKTGELKFTSKLRPFIHPLHELVDWLSPQLATHSALEIAVAPAQDTSALMLARILISLKRAGRDSAIVVGRSASQTEVAQAVRLVNTTLPETAAPEQLSLYVRLGGYSLRMPGNVAAHNIPRVQDAQGFRFDTATLGQALAGKRVESSQLSFMSGVASEPLTLALFELGRSSQLLELVLN
ncbi:MAG TPA: hypothetical protein VF331_22760 [Polyangiales bacterium]